MSKAKIKKDASIGLQICMKRLLKYIQKNKSILLFAIIYSAIVFILSPMSALIDDSALYADIGKNLLNNMCFCSNYELQPFTPPVFPVLVAISMALFGAFFIKALLVGISFFGIIVSYHFIMKISDNKKIALLSSVLFFLTPLVIYNSMLPLIDVLFAALIILSMLAYVTFLENKEFKTLVLLAGLVALTIMTKMVGYLLIFIFVVHFILERKKHKIAFRKLIILLVFIALFLTPWTLWRWSLGLNEVNVGNLLLFDSGYGHISLKIESFYSSGEPMNYVPLSLDINVPPQIVNVARIAVTLFVYVTPLITIYFLYSLTKFRKQFKGRFDSLLLIWIFAFLAYHAFGFFYFGARYLIPAVLPMVYFFSRFLCSKKIEKNKFILISLIAIQLLSVVGITYYDSQFRWTKYQTDIFMQSGEWLRDNTEPGAKILSPGLGTALAYYSERKIVDFNETIPDYIVKSNFSTSIDIESYERETNTKFYLLKSFSDDKYYAEVYKRY
jgi:4-amino-4-deoxy-L-arabinose transferase-like glycosyltransferase